MLDISPLALFLSIVFSMLGIGYYIYGRKRSLYFKLASLALMIYPYLFNQAMALLIAGVIIAITPIALRYFDLE